MEKLYCPKCGEFQPYIVKEKRETYSVKNEPVEISAKVSYCKCCGEMLWNDELDNMNLRNSFDIYRQRHSLLTSEQIKGIREKYGMSQLLFSRVLGLGEKTITRYENGSIQDTAHNGLLTLVNNPDILSILLETNKSFLSESDYAKARKAVDSCRTQIVKTA